MSHPFALPRRPWRAGRAALLAAGTAVAAGRPLGAQAAQGTAGDTTHAAHAAPGSAGHAPADHAHAGHRLSVQAVGMVTRAAAAIDGRTLTEGYLTQPVAMAHARPFGARVRLTGTLNLEPLTLGRGQLNAGTYGEGYVDRRHPHTLVHEAVAALVGRPLGARGPQASLAAGKGFVAFGTDDPMMRPFALFPVNHHLAQLLERWTAIGGVRAPGAMLEASLFGGDEPAGPWAWPQLARFGDSWAVRATLRPTDVARVAAGVPGALELVGSVARVASPENPTGDGLDQRKASAALRWARGAALGPAGLGDRGAGEYLLVEWARTDEHLGSRRAFRYASVLAEGAVRRAAPFGGVELAVRAERTARPEEERLLDPFRTIRPHYEQHVLGITEWRSLTAALTAQLAPGALGLGGGASRVVPRLAPFVEVARTRPRALVTPSAFEPALFYGRRVPWSVSAGVRVGAGTPHRRMGRYGVAADP
jgi:hypothetical protein